MFSCPHCMFALTGRHSRVANNGTSEIVIDCKNCGAILRVMITTLREPDPKRLEKQKNKPKDPNTYCSICDSSISLGEQHKCSGAKKNEQVSR